MPDDRAKPMPGTDRQSRRWFPWAALLVFSAAGVFLAAPALGGVPARLVRSCGSWIATAGALELLSAVGFVALFKLVFAAPIGWRRSTPAALRALGASTILPGGGLIGPTIGAWSTSADKPSLSQLTRSTTTFVILTNAPGAIVLAGLGVLLWLGLPSGPHETALTILPALVAVGLLTATWRAGRACRRRASAGALRDGFTEARALVVAGNWKLSGAIGYYAFDNAVLWAAFHAYGRTPPIAVIVMGYLVGSLAGAVPLPAGLGAVEGGLIGALVLYGAPAASAAAAVLLYRGISLSMPVVLGAVGWACGPVGHQVHRLHRRHAPLIDPAITKRRAAAELVTGQAD